MKLEDAKKLGDFKLGDFLCFAIYSTNLAFGRAYKPTLERLGLTYPQYIAIVALGEVDNQTVSSLGERMFLDSNTLTPLLKKLEAKGYVTRRRDRQDERQVVVSLTEAGRGLLETELSADLMRSTGLGPEQFLSLQQSVVALRDNLIKASGAK